MYVFVAYDPPIIIMFTDNDDNLTYSPFVSTEYEPVEPVFLKEPSYFNFVIASMTGAITGSVLLPSLLFLVLSRMDDMGAPKLYISAIVTSILGGAFLGAFGGYAIILASHRRKMERK